jgi:hypothetical protein
VRRLSASLTQNLLRGEPLPGLFLNAIFRSNNKAYRQSFISVSQRTTGVTDNRDAGFNGAGLVLMWCCTGIFCGARMRLLRCFACAFVVLLGKSAFYFCRNLLIFSKINHVKILTPPPPHPESRAQSVSQKSCFYSF